MALATRANASSLCRSNMPSRTTRMVVTRATSPRQELNLTMTNIALTTAAAAAMLLAVPTPSFAVEASSPSSPAPTGSAPASPSSNERTSTVSSISFARVDMSVTEKLRQRDDNMAWKCKGVNMYDCDGELAEAAEKRFEEIANIFRGESKP
ncbi:hypothetical protein VOLCADRAFT_121476 [Volvox carteri f. nagariensis]|uniref:Uncharacterized protein n=1 Tax=Volvox carteri f. nagariensis TaxID=3068 RepID=D8UBA8_VOLCA|nr:uncharacterized protein VOLCADRAFT_121476 [Volvox carteri f. nagariensis]EFJ42970.1 hypothetical protein VOLCADRAFT_121476 [Volvox carteri f. nagariensis]|eukprot:XP_002956010.1 hypothetical protein VOLCADRAFT_121476 [Volvox carteri f. nagariensis]